jgi:hypothetical protein
MTHAAALFPFHASCPCSLNQSVKHEVPVWLCRGLDDLALCPGLGRSPALQQEDHGRVAKVDDARDEDEPEGVADRGLALRAPASVSDVLPDEDVGAEAEEELGQPSDHGDQGQEKGHHVHTDQT